MNLTAHVVTLRVRDAMMLAVEVLSANPEALGNDALEGYLYLPARQAARRRSPGRGERKRLTPTGRAEPCCCSVLERGRRAPSS